MVDVNKFKQQAQEATLLSPIMKDREKMRTKDVVGRELTIVGFNFAPKFDKEGNLLIDNETGQPDEFGVIIFEEEPDKYYCVGTVFTKVCKLWAADYPTVSDASDALRASGGVRVKFSEGETKKGNNLVNVSIL